MKSRSFFLLALVICFLTLTSEKCRQEAKSFSGVNKATATTGSNRYTVVPLVNKAKFIFAIKK